jgi:hypothetical protein
MKSSTFPRKFRRTIQEEEQPPKLVSLQPKFLSVDQVRTIYGLTRGVLYPLMKEGLVESISIVSRDRDGKTRSRGKRIVSVESLENYLAGLAKAGINDAQSAVAR